MSRPKWARARAAVVMAALLATMVGCDSTEERPTPEPDNITAPGTELGFGDTARVRRADDQGTVEVAIIETEAGDPADLEESGYEDADTKTVYYVRAEVTPIAGTAPFDLKDHLNVFAGEVALNPLTIFEEFAPCEEAPVSPDDLGAPQDVCLTYVSDRGEPPPDTIYYDDRGEYDAADGNAISWR